MVTMVTTHYIYYTVLLWLLWLLHMVTTHGYYTLLLCSDQWKVDYQAQTKENVRSRVGTPEEKTIGVSTKNHF